MLGTTTALLGGVVAVSMGGRFGRRVEEVIVLCHIQLKSKENFKRFAGVTGFLILLAIILINGDFPLLQIIEVIAAIFIAPNQISQHESRQA
jgi:hypothetical protein